MVTIARNVLTCLTALLTRCSTVEASPRLMVVNISSGTLRGHVKLLINKTGVKTAGVSGLYFGGALSTPTTTLCSISISSSSLTIPNNGSANVSAQLLDFSGSSAITASPSATILVSPPSRTVSGSNIVRYTIGVKNKSGTVVFSSPCGSRIVPITVR